MYREKLIEAGLLRPRTAAQDHERKSVLQRIAQGEFVEKDFRPIYCVYRSDDWRNHVVYENEYRCQDAEMIEDMLTSSEAYSLCRALNIKSPDLPRTERKDLPLPIYKICKAEEWDEWQRDMAQLSLEFKE